MKSTVINIRVTEELKEELEIIGNETDISVSSLIRSILSDFVNAEKSIHVSSIENDKRNDVLQSLGFTELIFWIYDKLRNPEINEIDDLYFQFIHLIEELEDHPLFTKEIMFELNKISDELRRYLSGAIKNMDFSFSNIENENYFDYEMLSQFLYGLRYDEDDNRVLNIQ